MKKIVLLCSMGMTTGLLVKKMKEEADKIGYQCEITAHSITSLKAIYEDADIILLGPQVRYQENTLKENVSCPVEIIDMAAYGMVDGKKVLANVQKLIG
ncbi:MAG: PTS sugar transporter subunit IIB [Breznakia sp.]